jgi:hypothetical protein
VTRLADSKRSALAFGTLTVVTDSTRQQAQPRQPLLIHASVTQPLKPAAPAGRYVATWRVTSADGPPTPASTRSAPRRRHSETLRSHPTRRRCPPQPAPAAQRARLLEIAANEGVKYEYLGTLGLPAGSALPSPRLSSLESWPSPGGSAVLDAITAATGERWRSLIEMAAWCGLRFGGLAALRKNRIDLDTETVMVAESASVLAGGVRHVGLAEV